VLALPEPVPMPRLELGGRPLDEVVLPSDAAFTFRVPAAAAGGRERELVPYHRVTHERYALYWQLA